MRKKKLLSRLEGGQTLILLSTRQVGREIPIISKYEPSIYRLLGLDSDSTGALIDSLLVDIPQGSDLELEHTRWSKTFGELRGSPTHQTCHQCMVRKGQCGTSRLIATS